MSTVGSLFTGVGGLDRALEAEGHTVIWQAERELAARRVLADKWPRVRCYHDVKEIDVQAQRPEILCGGFPCQDISLAGSGAGIDGKRSGLWGEFARIIRALEPDVVFIENVAALTRRGLDRVLRDLAEVGMDAIWDCFQAAEVGAPHRRERLFLLAYRPAVGLADAHRFPLRQLAERDQWGWRGERAPERGDAVALDDRGAVADPAGARREDADDAGGASNGAPAPRCGDEESQRGGRSSVGLADADEIRLQAGAEGRGVPRGGPDALTRGGRRGSTVGVAHADGRRREGVRFQEPDGQRGAPWDELDGRSGARRLDHIFPPGPAGIGGWDGPQPAVRRGDARLSAGLDGGWYSANKTADRLQLLGNACCPQQANLAWRTLIARALRADEERAA